MCILFSALRSRAVALIFSVIIIVISTDALYLDVHYVCLIIWILVSALRSRAGALNCCCNYQNCRWLNVNGMEQRRMRLLCQMTTMNGKALGGPDNNYLGMRRRTTRGKRDRQSG